LTAKLDAGVRFFLRYFCTTLFIVLALILLTNVYLRQLNDLANWLERRDLADWAVTVRGFAPLTSMHWFDEIVELLFAYLVFYGAAALWGTKGHFSIGDWISKRLPGKHLVAFYQLCVTAIAFVFVAVFCWYSYRLTVSTTELSTVFQIPKGVMYSCMPVSSFIMLCYSAGDLVRGIKNLISPKDGMSGQGATSM
jgi:TRAP-type C4-dicarboxylate transport system permease small subunit